MVNVVDLKVTHLGSTYGDLFAMEELTGDPHYEQFNRLGSEHLMEFAGRSCYQSFHRPNPYTEDIGDYLTHIIEQGHESVLEHASVSFYIEGVSRSLTHELVRHRHFSYSQLSQRFVDESDLDIVLPPAAGIDTLEGQAIYSTAESCEYDYRRLVKELQETRGLPRKQAREAARAVLPNCTETKIVVTGNHRAWRDFLKKRLAPGADAEIRRLAETVLDKLSRDYPEIYQDIQELKEEHSKEN